MMKLNQVAIVMYMYTYTDVYMETYRNEQNNTKL